MKKYRYVAGLLVVLLAWSCIKKDGALPDIVPAVTLFELQGMTGPATINADQRVITVELQEEVDMSQVPILNFTVTRDAVISPEVVPGTSTVDLSSGEATYTLTTNQTFTWTVRATRQINRSAIAQNMLSSHINVMARSVLLLFSPSQSLDDIQITTLKLGPVGAETTPDPATVHDFTLPVKFTVTYGGASEEWTISAEHSSASVVTGAVNPFALFVLADGNYDGTGAPTFRYRQQGAADWTTFPPEEVTINNNLISARIGGLAENTAYEICAVNGTDEGEVKTFTTETVSLGYNMGFEDWNQVAYSGRNCWYPNATQDNPWWDSGNRGANTLREVNPTMPETSVVISGKAAKMASTKILTMFAAGNLYSGSYLETIATPALGGKISFGRPYTSRPTRLTGWYYYTPGTIDNVREPYLDLQGQPDQCSIYILLADWTEPYIINTAEKIYLDLDRDPGIIAIGTLFSNEPTNGYKQFSLELEYRSLTRRPTHIVIVASASRYGDYFTGSTGSVLYVDEFALEFD